MCLANTPKRTQASLSAKGQPWTLAKSFHSACPYSPPFKVTGSPEMLGELELVLQVGT